MQQQQHIIFSHRPQSMIEADMHMKTNKQHNERKIKTMRERERDRETRKSNRKEENRGAPSHR